MSKTNWDVKIPQEHLDIIYSVLIITENDIKNIVINKGGLNNNTYIITLNDGKTYLYRIPGGDTEIFCDRYVECETYKLLKPYNISDEVLYFDPDTGNKLTVYYQNSRTADVNSDSDCEASMDLLRKFHSLPITLPVTLSVFDRIDKKLAMAKQRGGSFNDDFEEWFSNIYLPLKATYEKLPVKIVPAPGDFTPVNVLFKENGEVIILDLEFTANGDAYMDLGTFAHHHEMDDMGVERMMKFFLQREPNETERFKTFAQCGFVALRWYCWAAFQLARGMDYDTYYDFQQYSYNYAKKMLEKATDIATKNGLL